jgi:hypothetical protein|tara:strand:+ start:638 stop:817 length:180 start_codon:yes stop_codon:yes gene_type:complete
MSEVAVINGIQYIGCAAPNESVVQHTAVMDASQTIENAVLAGPVTFPNVMIITGNLVIV